MHESRIFSTGVRRLFEFAGKEGVGGSEAYFANCRFKKIEFCKGRGVWTPLTLSRSVHEIHLQ